MILVYFRSTLRTYTNPRNFSCDYCAILPCRPRRSDTVDKNAQVREAQMHVAGLTKSFENVLSEMETCAAQPPDTAAALRRVRPRLLSETLDF